MTATPWRTLRQARRNARLSTAQLAELSGVSPSYVSFLERGHRRNPSPEIVSALAEALGCTLTDIAFGVEHEQDTAARVDTLTAAHADLGDRLNSLKNDLAKQGAA